MTSYLRLRFVCCCLLWFGGLSGALATEGDALTAAIMHLAQQDEESRPLWRYVWIQPNTEVTPAQVDYAMNAACSVVMPIIRGQQITDEVLAYNLLDFDPFAPDRLPAVWDSLATDDPVFHVTRLLQQDDASPVPILAPYLSAFVAQEVTGKDDKRLDVIAAELSESVAPIFEARFLIEQLLDLRYYDFRGIKVGDDFGQILARAGYFMATSKKQRGLRANFLIRSGITGDQRVVVAIYGTTSPTPATITYDQFDGTDKPADQLIRNLLNFNTAADGSEGFLPMPNGLIEFVLVDKDQKIVAAAPNNLAVDFTKPHGHDATLRPAISCISCHSQGDALSMYRPVGNDFDLLPTPGSTTAEVAEIIGIYRRDLDSPDDAIGRARRDYAVAIAALIGSEEGAIEAFHQAITTTVHRYRYDLIDADQAAIELGLPQGSRLADAIAVEGFTDPEIALATRGVPLPRKSWNAIRVQLAESVVAAYDSDSSE